MTVEEIVGNVETSKENVPEVAVRKVGRDYPRVTPKGIQNVQMRLFGSPVRGELTESSDIDFLADAGNRTSPWFPAGLLDELEPYWNGR